jgi:hypothetical protein
MVKKLCSLSEPTYLVEGEGIGRKEGNKDLWWWWWWVIHFIARFASFMCTLFS